MGCGSSRLGGGMEGSVTEPVPSSIAMMHCRPTLLCGDAPAVTAPRPRRASAAASGGSQAGRGYTELPLGMPLKEWDDLHVRMWLLTLPPALQVYVDTLTSPGGLLLEWSEELLADAGVANAFHRKQLLQYRRQLGADIAQRTAAAAGQQEHSSTWGAGGRAADEPEAAVGIRQRAAAAAGQAHVRATVHGPANGHSQQQQQQQQQPYGGVRVGPLPVQQHASASASAAALPAGRGRISLLSAEDDLEASMRRSMSTPGPGVRPGSAGRRPAPLARSDTAGSCDVHTTGDAAAFARVPPAPVDAWGSTSGAGGQQQHERQQAPVPGGEARDDRDYRKEVVAEHGKGWVEGGVAASKGLVRSLGAMMPWPGDAAASLLVGLLELGERALINGRNWQQLNVRAVDLLQLVANNKQLQSDAQGYRSIMHRFINTLKGIREYFADFTNRNWLSRIVFGGRDETLFNELWSALGTLVADASLGVAIETRDMAAQVLQRLQTRQLCYEDDEARVRAQLVAQGGVDAVLADPRRLAAVAQGLGLGAQLTLLKVQEAASLLEANRCEGVHSLIPHPDLRILWRQCFSPRQDVDWALWWEAFPAELARVPVEQQVIDTLAARLALPRRRQLFQQRLRLLAAERISVVELRRGVAADADLLALVMQLTESTELDGGGCGHAEARCHLPPVDATFIGREEDIREVADMVVGGGGSASRCSSPTRHHQPQPQQQQQQQQHGKPPLHTQGHAGSSASSGSGGSRWGAASKPKAVCIVAEPGVGKSALANAAGWRLWEGGHLPGGAWHIELQGVDSVPELMARAGAALAVPKDARDGDSGICGVMAALQTAASRGPLLLVLDGAESLQGGGDVEAGGPDLESMLGEVLASVPSARVLLTSSEPVDVPGRDMEYFRLRPLTEPAAVALVRVLASGLSAQEAQQLADACGANPMLLRVAASAVASGAMGLQDTLARAQQGSSAAARATLGSGGGLRRSLDRSVGPQDGLPHLTRTLSPVASARGARAAISVPLTTAMCSPGSPSPGAGSGSPGPGSGAGSGVAPTPRPRHGRHASVVSRSMSWLLATITGSTLNSEGGSLGSGDTLQRSSRGGCVMAALLAGLTEDHRRAVAQLSIFPGPFDEDAAAAVLGAPAFAVRALLDALLGYSLVVQRSYSHAAAGGAGGSAGNATIGGVGGGGSALRGVWGRYSLHPSVLDPARALLGEQEPGLQQELQCRYVAHMAAQLMRADRLYAAGSVRTAMALCSELRQEYQAMLLMAATCADQARMLSEALGPAAIQALAATPLLNALVLDATPELEAFWRAVEAHARQCAKRCGTGQEDGGALKAAACLGALADRALAQALFKQTRYQDAEAAWRRALGAAACVCGPSSLEAAACHSGLGQVLAAQGHPAQAREQHEKALALRRAALGEDSLDVAASLTNLARCLRNMGCFKEAEQAYRQALRVRVALLGEDHPDVADSLNSVGVAAGQQGRHAEEEQLYRRALAIRMRAYGPDHPEVAQALNNIGTALSSQNKFPAAEKAFRDALAIKQRVLGPNHHTVGITLNNISRALRHQGRIAEAETCCRQALAVLEGALGPRHPAVTTAVSNVISLLKKQGKDTEARDLYRKYNPRWTTAAGQLGDEAVAGPTARANGHPQGPRQGGAPGPAAHRSGAASRDGAMQPAKEAAGQQRVPLPAAAVARQPQDQQQAEGTYVVSYDGAPPRTLTRNDASLLLRQAMVEAARLAEEELAEMQAREGTRPPPPAGNEEASRRPMTGSRLRAPTAPMRRSASASNLAAAAAAALLPVEAEADQSDKQRQRRAPCPLPQPSASSMAACEEGAGRAALLGRSAAGSVSASRSSSAPSRTSGSGTAGI